MSYPPLRSWPIGQDDFPSPPEPPDHWFYRMRKWLWPAILLMMGATALGIGGLTIASGDAGEALMAFILMAAFAVTCIVAATVAGFAIGLIEFSRLDYEHRVELIAGISSTLFFAIGTALQLSQNWLLH